jgi:tagaturonate reductase
MSKKLNRTTASAHLRRPVKILQFGKGNFLRAFLDWMVDVMNETTSFNGEVGIIQVNSRETDKRFHEQDGLFHIVINGIRNGAPAKEIRLIRSVAGIINPYEDYAAFLRAGENPDLAFIVSNTTEAGIVFDPSDVRSATVPGSFPGKLTALLYHRYRTFNGDRKKTVTILPCELIERNGEILRGKILEYAAHWHLENDFVTWIAEHTLFCNTLVDRIVPGYPKDEIEKIREETGFQDNLVVSAEPYHLWVIEPVPIRGFSMDDLRTAIPLQAAGLNVKFVSDLAQYRTSKVRILNGAHTCMVPVGYLRGMRTVREAVDDTFTGEFIRNAIHDEILPTIDMPGEELKQFAHDVIERFQNPFIRHELKSIALNSISKFQVRVLPSILEYIRRKQSVPQHLSFAFASLIVFYKGEWHGETMPVNDTPAVVDFFRSVWKNEDPGSIAHKVLSNQELWKQDLLPIPGLAQSVESHLRQIIKESREA